MHKPIYPPSSYPHWLNDLLQLVNRFPEQNIEADLGAMTLADLWATYLHLRRLADTQAAS